MLKADKAVLSVWPGKRVVNGGDERRACVASWSARLRRHERCRIARTSPAGSKCPGAANIASRSARLKRWQLRTTRCRQRRKNITAAKWSADRSSFTRGFLRGFFDADGSVQGNQVKGVSIRLAQSDLGAADRRSAHASAFGYREHDLSRTGNQPEPACCPTARAEQRHTRPKPSTNSSFRATISRCLRSGSALPNMRESASAAQLLAGYRRRLIVRVCRDGRTSSQLARPRSTTSQSRA